MSFSSQSTGFPGGLSNAAQHQTMAESAVPDPTVSYLLCEDFITYTSSDFTTTAVGTGTVALTSGLGGLLLVSTTAGAADAEYIQTVAANVQLTPGKAAYFKFKGQLSDATGSDFYAGWIAKSATPLAASDALFFFKAAAGTTLVLRSIIGGATTDYALPASNVYANAVDVELGFYVDTAGNVAVFFNPTTGSVPVAVGGVRGPVLRIAAPSLTQVLLCQSFGLRNSSAAARTLTVDFLVSSCER